MILVTGANGQLGSEFKLLLKDKKAIFMGSDECDISNLTQVEQAIITNKVEFIINCAAYTAVDLAEKESDKAFLVNENGASNLAYLSKKYSLVLVHVSTDYVFDGKSNTPIRENSVANPSSVYGKSKLAGEKRILEIAPMGAIIRTSWLYSSYGKNFVKTIIKAGAERGTLKVVYDQLGTPTYARDLATVIVAILPCLRGKALQVYHYSNEGAISWYDFAQAICELKAIPCKISAIESHDYPTPTPRPSYSVLCKEKIKQDFRIEIPYWKDSLKACLNEL